MSQVVSIMTSMAVKPSHWMFSASGQYRMSRLQSDDFFMKPMVWARGVAIHSQMAVARRQI
jgi:hypothetical protein